MTINLRTSVPQAFSQTTFFSNRKRDAEIDERLAEYNAAKRSKPLIEMHKEERDRKSKKKTKKGKKMKKKDKKQRKDKKKKSKKKKDEDDSDGSTPPVSSGHSRFLMNIENSLDCPR